MSVTSKDIADEFDVFGEEVDEDQLLKLQELCKSHCIDANAIVNQWMAFSTSKKVNITLETLQTFDREWLPKKLQSPKPKTPHSTQHKILNKDTINSVFEEEIEILGSYATPEEKSLITQAAKRQLTPENLNSSKKRIFGNNSPVAAGACTPISSPARSTPSAKYSVRSNAGDIVTEFGSTSNVTWKGEGIGCKVTHFDQALVLTSRLKYMFQKNSEIACVLNDAIQEMATVLQNAHGIEEYSHIALPSQESTTVCGRVCCDSVGRLNTQSVLLEGSREISGGKCMALDLTDLKQFSLFPGQIIACDGVNITGQKFAANKIYSSVPLPFPEVHRDQENAGDWLRFAVAAGPYAPSDGLDYSPLSDLIKYINRDKPDICVLMGPFVDIKNSLINSGDIDESFEDIFMKKMVEIGRATSGLGCKVVIVSSSRDVHHCHSVYPQPPYTLSKHKANSSKISNADVELTKHLMFVSDPSTLNVNGVVVGLTSTDILMHLSKSELAVGSPGGSDRMARLAQHIIHQRSYYPLYPPPEDVNLDIEAWEAYASLPTTPHILLLPSDLKSFIKDVGGCCCLNPGRLTTGIVGGTYAKVAVNLQSLTTSPSPASSCVAQIVKV